MLALRRALKAAAPRRAGDRRWVFAAYDQLTDAVGPLAQGDPRELGLVVVECPAKAARRPYHKQKLALVLANLRHFAVEQARRGVAVRHVVAPTSYAATLRELAAELGPLVMQRAAERELRVELQPLVDEGLLDVVPHEGWLTSAADFDALGEAPWRMDAFYRGVRRRTGLLMEDGKPLGGRFSHDGENRKPWRGEPPAPTPPRWTPDALTAEVLELVATRFAGHPGQLDGEALPCTLEHAEQLWAWARAECLPTFGPYEDAMSRSSSGLFHTRISPLLNVLRLLPARVVAEVADDTSMPLSSREGFVRQVLGWREFVRHVHERTDGFRRLPGRRVPVDDSGHARPDALAMRGDLPPVYWGDAPSGLACLDGVVEDVWREGWSHHITRLMVLGNLATLLDVSPRALTDWFWVAYTDAYDWVVEPNVLGMATFAVGELMTTKPYVSGAAYLDRMGDACKGCAFDPRSSCPITSLYWDFLERKQSRLQDNRRLAMPYRSLARRSDEQRARDAAVSRAVRRGLRDGRRLTPDALP